MLVRIVQFKDIVGNVETKNSLELRRQWGKSLNFKKWREKPLNSRKLKKYKSIKFVKIAKMAKEVVKFKKNGRNNR